MAKEVITRSMQREEDTWNTSDIFASAEEWKKTLKEALTLSEKIPGYKGRLCESAATLLEALKLNDEISGRLELVYGYSTLVHDQDTSDTLGQQLKAEAANAIMKVKMISAFFEPEILSLTEEKFESFCSELPGLSVYSFYIERLLRKKEHILSPEAEKLLSSALNVSSSPKDIYSMLTDADMTFPETDDGEGDRVRITDGNFIRLLSSPDREVRKAAFKNYYSSYAALTNTLSAIYRAQAEQLLFNAKARNYSSSLAAAVLSNDVPETVYRNLVETVDNNLDKLHRYVRLRKRVLGYEEHHMYDIYTPIVSDVARDYSIEEAKATVLEALKPLGEDYVNTVKKGFEERWIDVYENKGKRGGAYSEGLYGTHPFVLLNYDGTMMNVFTLAHEMGHAMHSYYSNSTQPYVYHMYKIFVAEVASITNEILLLEYLLGKVKDNKEKAFLLNYYLDCFKKTLFRQTQFAEFEMRSNDMLQNGESLNAQSLNSLYLEINKKFYGPDMVSDDEIKYEWERIPHFYLNFYVYQYSTCFCAAVKIAHDILREGEPVVKKYREFLSGGCAKMPIDLLKDMGVDLTEAKPIQEALDVMDGVLDEIEKLL